MNKRVFGLIRSAAASVGCSISFQRIRSAASILLCAILLPACGGAGGAGTAAAATGEKIEVAASSVANHTGASTKLANELTVNLAANAQAEIPAAIVSIEIAPGVVNLNPGSAQQLVAVGKLSDGSLVNLFGKVSWSIVSGNSVASITAEGLLKRLTTGTAEIQASALGKTARLTISSVGQSLTLGYDNSNSKWAKVNIYLWDGADPTPESAGSWPGTAMTVGANGNWTYGVDAKYLRNGAIRVIFNNGAGSQTGDLIASESARYSNGVWQPLVVDPTFAQVSVIDGTIKNGGSIFTSGSVLTLNANAAATPFSVWGGVSAAYIFTDPSKAEAQLVVPNGVSALALQALFASSSAISSSSVSSATSSASASSTAAAIASIQIAPGVVSLNPGSAQQLVAVGKLSDGSLVNLFGKVSWSIVSGNSVASITAEGLLKRLTTGTAEIQASAQGKTARLTLANAGQGLTLSYDNSNSKWAKVNIYLWDGADPTPESAGSWPGTAMTVGANGNWTYGVDAKYLRNGAIRVIFNNGAGSQTGDLIASESARYSNGVWQPLVVDPTFAQVSVIDGTIKNGGNIFAAGSLVTINANASTLPFNSWGGVSAAYIFTDPSKAEAQLVVPSGVTALTLQAMFASQLSSSVASVKSSSSKASSSSVRSSSAIISSSASSLVKASSSSSAIISSSAKSSSVAPPLSSSVASVKSSSSSSVSSSSVSISSSSATADPFTAARSLFATQCAGCHGANGTGGFGGVLNGLHASGKYTLATLATKISTTMPLGKVGNCPGTTPGSCGYDIANMIMANQWIASVQSSSASVASSVASVKSSSSTIASSVSSAKSSSVSSAPVSSVPALSSSSSSVASSSASMAKSSSSISSSLISSSSAVSSSSIAVSSSSVASSDPTALVAIEIAPGAAALSIGGSQQLVAVGKLGNGSLTSLFGKVSWRIASGGNVASITAGGLLKRLTAGSAVIEASAQGKIANLTLAAGDAGAISIAYDNTTSNWSKVNAYIWTSNGTVTSAWPGDAMILGANNIWTYNLDPGKLVNGSVNIIFTNKPEGSAQTADLTVGQSSVYKNGVWTPKVPATTSAQVAVIDGSIEGGGTSFAAGTVLTLNANTSTTAFSGWSGASAAYIFTDPALAKAQLVVPSGVDSLALQALFAAVADPFKTARNLYAAQCAGCHGVNGSLGLNSLHLGGSYTLASLAVKISTTMPRNNVGACAGTTPGTCGYDIANMILENKWLAPTSCSGASCNAGDSLDSRNLRLLTTEEYLNSARDIFAINFAAEVMASALGDGANRNFNTASSLALNYDRTLGYQMAAAAIAEQVIAAKSFVSLAGNCSDAQCAVAALGKKVFRRPLSAGEVARYLDLHSSDNSGRAVVQAMLISPYFMYRSELGVLDPATGLYRLNNYEIASLLSYSLWASTPDDSLLAAAEGALDIRAQVVRMLADAKAERGLRRFAQGWLINGKYGYSAIASTSLAAAFDEETIRFTMETIKADLPYKTFLTANYTYANPELAQYYGSAAVASGWLKSVFGDSDPRRGAGILGHGSFLATRVSSIENPSPIKRGTFVRDVLMCQELPPPQKAGLSIPKGPEDTNRTANERHTNDPACQGCHQYIDGVGFGFEKYGSNAKYRETETLTSGVETAINANGAIKSLDSAETKLDPNSTAVPYQAVPELATLIANSGQGSACYSRQFYRYIVGRNEEVGDEKIIPAYSSNLRAGGGMKEMIINLAVNPSFILRRQ